MQDESTSFFKKIKDDKTVSPTACCKWCLLASWLGFQDLLDYNISWLSVKREMMNALTILRDVQKGQERMKVAKENQLSIDEKSSLDDIQNILSKHYTGSPKLQQLLPILAGVVVLRKERPLLWVDNPT
jgi:hypothetical protein